MGWLQDVDHYCEGCGERITHKPYDREVQVLHHGVNGTQPSQYATQPQPVYSPESRK
ncbi:uncharacterized protein K489DRAFT_375055 [Dissoconium aciculare CBS 342.82]|uniref:Uncharacterized protein n=1 Tax=Dissoconium aciculare CBS 342.82 TaxID=1314786 RepID=A0A6J3MG84_9PEZI|nr:uncharacterized protein K489DRAFT_375055 [Dissoconium aciculare CBS 342.82]KAF1826970.1 hypothetical protein K489DRAFT_375055 [Dissoconium aciculare CBS 342.82]